MERDKSSMTIRNFDKTIKCNTIYVYTLFIAIAHQMLNISNVVLILKMQ